MCDRVYERRRRIPGFLWLAGGIFFIGSFWCDNYNPAGYYIDGAILVALVVLIFKPDSEKYRNQVREVESHSVKFHKSS